ncbi:O-antigen ligase family protein [Fulvivirga sp. 2943]|uniref:O-antigen ligase family protein n=2 Tax=Fulvivirga sediminis TaxID=2803949 RepID=A0A937F536_9BACT|nr:O-antigen ligase family protein [Fulvivirga sediminis]
MINKIPNIQALCWQAFSLSVALTIFQKVSSLIFAVFIVLSLSHGFKRTNNRAFNFYAVVLGLFFLYMCVRDYVNYSPMFWKKTEKNLSIIAILPIFYSPISVSKKVINRTFYYIIIVMFIVLCTSYSVAVYRSGQLYPIDNGESFFYSNPFSRQEYTKLFGSIHPGYLSMFILISLVFIFEIILKSEVVLKKVGLALIFIFFTINVLILSSKTALFLLFLILIYYALKILFRKKWLIYTVPIVFLFAVFMAFLIRGDKQLNYRLDSESSISYQYKYEQWTASWELITENWLFGVSGVDLQPKLNDVYDAKNYNLSLKEGLNSHNQYLQTFAAYGVIGILFLLFILFFPFKWAIYSPLYFWFLFLFIVFNIFESSFARYDSIFFFFTLNSLFLKYNSQWRF